MTSRTVKRSPIRSAFTLIEMLVVMAIIAVLGSLIAAGIMGWMSGQARRNTEATIRAVHAALMQHWDVVVKDARDERSIPASVLTFADNDPARARVIWIKARLMEAFPVNFTEVTNGYGTPPLSYIPTGSRRYMSGYQEAIKNRTALKTQAKSESAACLLLALNVNRSGVGHSADLLRPLSRDIDEDKVNELVDGWSEPLRFYRFAYNNFTLQKTYPSTLLSPNLDPLDPKGLLIKPGWSQATTFDSWFHKRLNGSEAWYAVPVICSSGPDLILGITPNTAAAQDTYSGAPTGAAPFQDMAIGQLKFVQDNLWSFQSK